MGKFFGTDGIRGIYGVDLTDEIAYMTANALTLIKERPTVVLGRDTRLSGPKLAKSIISGVTDGGGKIINLNIVPTPAVAYLTKLLGADYGIVISASHNPYNYNGIKIFNKNGVKLTYREERGIENHIMANIPYVLDEGLEGDVESDVTHNKSYFDFIINSAKCRLDGLKVVLDCSRGAVYDIAPKVFKALGATVIAYNDNADGREINNNCGALYPEVASQYVKENRADIGFSFDGDADRLIACDENGHTVDGDDIIYIIALDLLNRGLLKKPYAVGTLHTNMGVEQSLKQHGIGLYRTDIGDHYVVEKMIKDDLLVGGEQSGHIILRQFSETGDGLLAAVNIACLIKSSGKKLSELCSATHYPQVNVNIIVNDKARIMNDVGLYELRKSCETELGDTGRILLRASGTEPKIRIMVECKDKEFGSSIAYKLKDYIDGINQY